MSRGLENQLFQLKFTAKQMGRLSTKCLKEEKTEKEKIKKCLEKDNHDGARIHAQNAIRAKTNAQNYLRLSSRVDAVASRLESAIKMQQVTKSMGSVVKGMDKVLGSMNVEAISKARRAARRASPPRAARGASPYPAPRPRLPSEPTGHGQL
jgi:charged multivesicular body protein 1